MSFAAALSAGCADGDPGEEEDSADHDGAGHEHHDHGGADALGSSQAAVTNTWTRCANEFATCTFTGRRDVRLIAPDGRNVVREFSLSASCKVSAFGSDPAPGITKYCEYGPDKTVTTPTPTPTPTPAPAPAPTPTTATWTRCGNEFSTCTFKGLRDVRMTTADGRKVVREFFQEASCSVGAFGSDPAPGASKYCEMGPQKFTTLPAPSSMMASNIDLTQIPLGSRGYSVERVQAKSEAPAKDTIGAFRTVCSLSHMNFDDPIVFPNKPGAAHLHAFFGNTMANYASTADSLATTGNGTCRGGTVNRSAYWVPALVDTRNGKAVMPVEGHFYYKTGYRGISPAAVQPMPKGLRMIGGTASAKGPQEFTNWGCIDGSLTGPAIQNCGVGQTLQMSITFPQCWDGKNLDSPDHKSHMAYAYGSCPATHPVPLPEISFHIRYKVEEVNAPLYWRLSSDMYDTSLPGGYSAHGDWFDGWKEEIKNTFVKNCDQKSVDCHSNLLGDGREIF